MDYQKLTHYPDHPEPAPDVRSAGEDRPRTAPSSIAALGVTALLVVVAMPFLLFNTDLKQLWDQPILQNLRRQMQDSALVANLVFITMAVAGLAVLFLAVSTYRAFTANAPRNR